MNVLTAASYRKQLSDDATSSRLENRISILGMGEKCSLQNRIWTKSEAHHLTVQWEKLRQSEQLQFLQPSVNSNDNIIQKFMQIFFPNRDV
jgi:hypothetical protein